MSFEQNVGNECGFISLNTNCIAELGDGFALVIPELAHERLDKWAPTIVGEIARPEAANWTRASPEFNDGLHNEGFVHDQSSFPCCHALGDDQNIAE